MMKLDRSDIGKIKEFLKRQLWLLIAILVIIFTFVGAIS